MVRDEEGVQKYWRKVEVKLEKHVKVPVFPEGLEKYDECLQEYITKISMEPLPFSRPLWDISIIKYPTSSAAGNFLFRFHHALGDGFSLMAALFSFLKRSDDPSRPLTFPSSSSSSSSSEDVKKAEKRQQRKRWMSLFHDFLRFPSACVNTVADFGWSLMKSTVLEDSVSTIRSGVPFVDCRPTTLSYVTFSLDDIKRIKNKVNGSVNDVLVGMIFHCIHLYMQEVDSCSSNKSSPKVTALVLLNTRAITSYKSMEEMRKPNSKARWGNQFAFLHIPFPRFENNNKKKKVDDPIHFVLQAKKYIRAKRFSFGLHLTGAFLEIIRKLIGPQAASSYTRKTLTNSSLAISNVIGPMKQVQLHGHPISGFHFMVVGNPQSLTITILSYMGNVRVAFGAEKGFIDSQLLVSCMEKSFEMLNKAVVVDKEDQVYRHELHAKQT